MGDQEFTPKKLSMTNTKKELLESYEKVVKLLAEKAKAKLNPQKIVEEKQKKEAVKKVEEFTADKINAGISGLSEEITKLLDDLKFKLRNEIKRYEDIQKAISVKDAELKEIFEIEKSAYSLAALIEAQNTRKEDFELEFAEMKKKLSSEIEDTKKEWEKEKSEHQKIVAELKAEEDKKRKREKEEYEYNFNREKILAKNKFEDELKIREKETLEKLNQKEIELNEREKTISEKENEYRELKSKVDNFDKEIKLAVDAAVKEAVEKIEIEYKNKEELLKKESEGRENVLTTKIASLEKLVQEQEKKVVELSGKLDKAYQKVQDVALKAIDGAANMKSFNELQKILSSSTKKED